MAILLGTKGVTVVDVALILFGSALCSESCNLNKYRRNRWCGWKYSGHMLFFLGFFELWLVHMSMFQEPLMVAIHYYNYDGVGVGGAIFR